MAAPGQHVEAAGGAGAGAGRGAAVVEGEETEEEEEGEAEGEAALRAVFPRDPELFADAFPVRRRFRFCGRSLRIVQRHGPGLGTAGAVWEAALFLCRFLEQQRFDLRGRSVIELGAGTGIVGIVAALLGGDVTITDQPVALEQIRENVGLNFLAGNGWGVPRVRALRWGLDHGSFPEGGFGVVLGSDIVYDPSLFAPLLRTLQHLCGPPSLALLSVPVRGGDRGSSYFFSHMVPPHFTVQLLQREPQHDIEIYGLTWKGGGSLEEGGTLKKRKGDPRERGSYRRTPEQRRRGNLEEDHKEENGGHLRKGGGRI